MCYGEYLLCKEDEEFLDALFDFDEAEKEEEPD